MDTLLLLLFLGCVAVCVYLVVERRGGVDTATVQRSREEVLALAVTMIPGGTMSMRSSWMPLGNTDRSATFVYKRRTSILVALVLLLFFLVPGILYLVFGGMNQTLTVNVLPGSEGRTTVQVAASGATARRRGRQFLRGLEGVRGGLAADTQRGPTTPRAGEPQPGHRPEPPQSSGR